jgi:isopentenyl-diphosphate delta-isomerase
LFTLIRCRSGFSLKANHITRPSIDIIEELIEKAEYPLIIKEVGQGMGSQSLKRLLQLPIEAIEFGAFGGANFSMVELLRRDKDERDVYKPLAYVGHTAEQMVDAINHLSASVDFVCRQLIVSGGIKNFLDGYYLMKKSTVPALYGQASAILKYAKQSYEELFKYIEMQVKGLSLAEAFLRINPDYLRLSKNKNAKRIGGTPCPKESLSESPAPAA